MANYDLEWDAEKQILICRVTGFMPDAEVELFAADLLRMGLQARRARGSLRLLFDNKDGAVFSAAAAAALFSLKERAMPDDRTAVVVAGTLNKLQATREKVGDTELFDSEPEAMAWLMTAT